MNVFLDANILVSVVNKEYPSFTHCSRVLSLAENSRFKICTSSLCLAITWYFSEKKSGPKEARRKITELIKHISITQSNELMVKKTIANKKINDLEDGLQYYSALDSKCKCIVTADKKDFYFSEIEVLNAEEFLEEYWVGEK
jgi:predicted nucleic acid-binding protein